MYYEDIMMDEKKIITKEVLPEESPKPDSNPDDMGRVKLREYLPLYDYFNLDEEAKHDKAFEKIWEWGKKQAPEQTKDEILYQISKLNNRLGITPLGDLSYSKLTIWIDNWYRMRQAEEIMKGMERQ